MLDAEEANHVADQEVVLHRLGEVRAADDLARGDRADFLLEQLVHFEAVAFGSHLVRPATSAVCGVVVAPFVERDAMRVRRVRGVHRDGVPTRIEPIHRRGGRLQRWPPRMLVVVDHEDAALPIDSAVGTIDQIVRTVVRVGRVKPLEQDSPHVGHIVAVGVFEEQQFGLTSDDHAAVPELEAERVLHLRKLGDAIGDAVVVVVVEDHEGVVHRLERFPLRVRWPDSGPQSPLGVELHLHGVHKFLETCFVREQADLETLGDSHLLDGLFAADVVQIAFLHGAGTFAAAADVRDHGHRHGHVAVVDRHFFARSGSPDVSCHGSPSSRRAFSVRVATPRHCSGYRQT